MKLDADDIYVAYHEGRINSSDEYYPASEYEALEAKLNMLSDHERKIEAWENAAREITRYVKYITAELDELKAAIAAAKVKP